MGGCFSLYRLPRPKTIRICLDMYGVDAHIYVAIYCIVCRLLLSCQLFNLFQANKRTKDTISDWLSIWANAIGGKCGRMLLKSFYAFFRVYFFFFLFLNIFLGLLLLQHFCSNKFSTYPHIAHLLIIQQSRTQNCITNKPAKPNKLDIKRDPKTRLAHRTRCPEIINNQNLVNMRIIRQN